MARTKVYFEKRVGAIARNLDLGKASIFWQLQLHCYTPGNQRLYQMQIVDKRDGSVQMSFPNGLNLNSHDFELYLNGLVDSTNIIGLWRND